MKNLLRIVAFSLVATGAFAATQINNTVTPATSTKLMPMPVCPPDGQATCGLGNN